LHDFETSVRADLYHLARVDLGPNAPYLFIGLHRHAENLQHGAPARYCRRVYCLRYGLL